MAFRADDWLVGSRSTDVVGRRLRRLGATWRVVPGVTRGQGVRASHVVFGRAGVFVIDVQHGDDRPSRPSQKERRVPEVRSLLPGLADEARKLARVLTRSSGAEVAVCPLLVVTAGILDVQKQAFGVYVIAEQLIVPWLKSLPAVLDDPTVTALYRLVADPTTWTG